LDLAALLYYQGSACGLCYLLFCIPKTTQERGYKQHHHHRRQRGVWRWLPPLPRLSRKNIAAGARARTLPKQGGWFFSLSATHAACLSLSGAARRAFLLAWRLLTIAPHATFLRWLWRLVVLSRGACFAGAGVCLGAARATCSAGAYRALAAKRSGMASRQAGHSVA